MSYSPSVGQGALLRVSGAMAHGRPPAIRAALVDALSSAEPTEVEESILQAYLFLGYPAALNAFAIWREVSGRLAEVDTSALPEDWERRGEQVCRVIYGGQYDRLRENVRALHPAMERWMVVEGYGKVLGRPGLDLMVRELCIIVILAVQRVPRQLYSHIRGAVNAGATNAAIEDALAVAAEWQTVDGVAESRRVWEQVNRRGR